MCVVYGSVRSAVKQKILILTMVQLYGNLEWMFKWLKIMLLVALCILMIAVKAGGEFDINPACYGQLKLTIRSGTWKNYYRQVDSSSYKDLINLNSRLGYSARLEFNRVFRSTRLGRYFYSYRYSRYMGKDSCHLVSAFVSTFSWKNVANVAL